jgi:uncharacterized protein (TIRG00374 family)
MSRKVLLGLALGAIFLALALRVVPLEDLRGALGSLEVAWLAPITALYLVQQVLRGLRQGLLVRAVRPGAGWWGQIGVLCMSFFFINTLPVKLGEIARPWLLLQQDEVPLGAGFGVVFAERALDLIFVLLVLSMVFATAPVPEGSGETIWSMIALARTAMFVGAPPLILGVAGLVVFGEPARRALERLLELAQGLLPFDGVRRASRLLLAFAGAFSEGLAAFRSPALLALLLALTAGIWGLTGWIYVMLAHALHIQSLIGWLEGMGVLVISMLASAVPAPPGMAGVYEAFCRAGLALYGVRGAGPGGESLDSVALAFAVVVHWWLYLVQSGTAIYFFWAQKVDPRETWRLAKDGIAAFRRG